MVAMGPSLEVNEVSHTDDADLEGEHCQEGKNHQHECQRHRHFCMVVYRGAHKASFNRYVNEARMHLETNL